MKKLTLTSLMAVFAVSAANAAVINDNPLYRPDQGKFYSVTEVASHSEYTDTWALREGFGYGVTDKLSVAVLTDVAEQDWFDYNNWGDLTFGASYRALDMGNIKADVYGAYTVTPVWGDHSPFLDKDMTNYGWTAGVRAGYVTDMWTVAGHFAFTYGNTESFNWNDEGIHQLKAGVDGFLSLTPDWALYAGAEYTGYTDDEFDNAGTWDGKLGVNYNIDANKFVGAYVSTTLRHATGDWEFDDGFGFGGKFGIQF